MPHNPDGDSTAIIALLFVISPNHGFVISFNPLSDDKILDWSKLKQIADDILKCI